MAALVAAGLAASALVACSQHDAAPSDDITGAPWADGVEQFYEAWDAADQVGFTTAAVFFAQDAHQDFRYFNDFEGTGRAAIAQNYRDSMQIPPVFAGGFNQADASVGNALDEPFYISTDSAVGVSHSIGWQGISAASVERMSRAGIVDQTGLLTPSTAAQFFSTPAASYSTAGERFVAAWASGHADAVRALYADGATLVDSSQTSMCPALRGSPAWSDSPLNAVAWVPQTCTCCPRAQALPSTSTDRSSSRRTK